MPRELCLDFPYLIVYHSNFIKRLGSETVTEKRENIRKGVSNKCLAGYVLTFPTLLSITQIL
jgi:hypothetical protein